MSVWFARISSLNLEVLRRAMTKVVIFQQTPMWIWNGVFLASGNESRDYFLDTNDSCNFVTVTCGSLEITADRNKDFLGKCKKYKKIWFFLNARHSAWTSSLLHIPLHFIHLSSPWPSRSVTFSPLSLSRNLFRDCVPGWSTTWRGEASIYRHY